jgi:hypothetical protein
LVGALGHQSGQRPSSGELSSTAMAAGPRWTEPAQSRDFALRPLIFFNINPQSLILKLGPWNLKNNSKKVPSLRKIHKNSPETSKFHIFSTTTPNPVIPSPKFSGSLLLSFYAFI